MSSSLFHASDAQIESLERLHDRAEGQIVQNDFEGAIRTYSDILLVEPDDETAYEGLGNCYLLLGRYRKATEAYRYALSINPQNEAAILGLQKIMDPDGVEGMVHPLQVEGEAYETAFDALSASGPELESLPLPAPKKAIALPAKPAAPPVVRQKAAVHDPGPAAPKKLKAEKPQAVLGEAKAALPEKPSPARAVPLLKPLNKFGRLERLDVEKANPLPPLPTAVVRRAEPPAAIEAAPEVPLPRFNAVPAPEARPAPAKADKPAVKSVRSSAPSKFSKTGSSRPAAPKKTFVKPAPIVREAVAAKKDAKIQILDTVDAREIQKALRNTGFYSGPIDGILGPGSRKAVKDYQILHELTPDGIVGPRTWASLRLYLDPNEA